MINVIVVDDEWYNLEEIADLVEKTGCMKVKQKYQNPVTALNEFVTIAPDVAFIDMDMPEIDGTTLARKFLELKPTIIIVFITAWTQFAVDAFDLNAVDYIVKPIRKDRFDTMIEKVRHKMSLIKNTTTCPNILSPREIEVLTLVSHGLTHNKIAENLNVSLSTVKRYMESIYGKLDVNNKISAVKKAESLNIL